MNNSGSVKSGRLPTWGIQWRVIHALIMREIITRFGRNNIGFLWLAIEPMLFAIIIVIIRHLMRQHFHSVEIVPFFVIGYGNVMAWRFCVARGQKAIDANRNLLHYRQIRVQDIFLARMLLEVAGVAISFLFLWLICALLGLMTWPADPFLLVVGWFFCCWFAASFGTLIGCLTEFTQVVARIWSPINYASLLISGLFFQVDWLPKALQELVLWVPLVHPMEMTRAGYWGGSHWHYSMMFMTMVCMTMTLLSGLLMRNRALRDPHL